MNTKSEENAALRFHRKLKRMHRIGFYYNVGHGSYWVAAYHFACYVIETMATEYHQRNLKQTTWSEKKQGIRIKALHAGD